MRASSQITSLVLLTASAAALTCPAHAGGVNTYAGFSEEYSFGHGNRAHIGYNTAPNIQNGNYTTLPLLNTSALTQSAVCEELADLGRPCNIGLGGTISANPNLTSSFDGVSSSTDGRLVAASAHADLSTGQIGVSGNSQSNSTGAEGYADFYDGLNFSIANATAATVTNIRVILTINGAVSTFVDAAGGGSANATNLLDFGGARMTYFVSSGDGVPSSSLTANGWVSYSFTGPIEQTTFTGVYALVGASQRLTFIDGLWTSVSYAHAFSDFDHTSTFAFDLPSNVTFTSDSGVFLTSNAAPAVPEPATWAMMLFGFALVGSAVRRRTGARAAAHLV